jgi:hypothetical protein
MHNLPVPINICVPEGEAFDVEKLKKGDYSFGVMGGQHIVACDQTLLFERYHKAKPDEIPKTVKNKQCELFVNLTPDQEGIYVTAHNLRHQLNNQWFDKVIGCVFHIEIL